MAELRRLLGVLGESENGEAPPLAPQAGIANLEALIARVREAGLPVDLKVEGQARPLAPGVEVAAYRIVQEALTNALKYAGGAPAHALVRYSEGAVDIDVVDEGRLQAPSEGIGRGLTGMRERVALFGGTLVTGAEAAGGYGVHAHLPLEAQD
jgi:signal transduction histidine kinase